MIARLAWYGSLVAIGVVTVLLQFDRQAAVSPEFAGLVPGPFRAVSQARITAASLTANDPALALEEAERLVLRRPVPAQSLRMLAFAQYRAGQLEDGSVSIQYAAKRGWRDIAAQEAMARLALAAGDPAEAARRFSALLVRREATDASLNDLGAQIFGGGDPVAIQTMAELVGGSARWTGAFLGRGSRVMPADAFSRIVAESLAKGAQFDCPTLRRVAEGFEKRGKAGGSRLAVAAASACKDGA